MRSVRFAVFCLTVLAMACAAGGGGGDGTPRRNPNLISSLELADVAATTAFEAVQRLRPNWLRGRGGAMPVVMVDGNQQGRGNIDSLRDYRIDMIREVRYISPTDATMRYGTGFQGGIIDLILR